MTLRKLLANHKFNKLPLEQRLVASVLIMYDKRDIQSLRSNPLLDGIDFEETLAAIEKTLPVRFSTKNGKTFCKWVAGG